MPTNSHTAHCRSRTAGVDAMHLLGDRTFPPTFHRVPSLFSLSPVRFVGRHSAHSHSDIDTEQHKRKSGAQGGKQLYEMACKTRLAQMRSGSIESLYCLGLFVCGVWTQDFPMVTM